MPASKTTVTLVNIATPVTSKLLHEIIEADTECEFGVFF